MMSVLTGFSMYMMFQLNQDVGQVAQDRNEPVQLTMELRSELADIERQLNYMVLDTSPTGQQKELARIRQAQSDFQMTFDQLKGLLDHPVSQRLYSNLEVQYRIFEDTVKECITAALSDSEGNSPQLLAGDVQNASLVTDRILLDLKAFQEQQMNLSIDESRHTYRLAMIWMACLLPGALILMFLFSIFLIRSIRRSLTRLTDVISTASFSTTEQLPRIQTISRDEIGQIAIAYNEMAQALEDHMDNEQQFKALLQRESWLKSKLAEMNGLYHGVQDMTALASVFINNISPIADAKYGVFYLTCYDGTARKLKKMASYAVDGQKVGEAFFMFGEGLVGQCALEKKTISVASVPRDYIRIRSGLGHSAPSTILVQPIVFEDEVVAVIELASFEDFTPLQRELLEQIVAGLGVSIHRVAVHMRLQGLLQESQSLTEELQSQSEEMQLQQEELRAMNEELTKQMETSAEKTVELEKVREALEDKASQVETSSKYKSEFLANMSHELRTPLNSMLILAQMLYENEEGNLTPKQREFAHTIHSSGSDLLQLINQVLDLSKVESGKMVISPGEVNLLELVQTLRRSFNPVVGLKGLKLDFHMEKGLPTTVHTDELRLQQILNNLLSNAIKFTERGGITVRLSPVSKESVSLIKGSASGLPGGSLGVAFSVADTGIGIPQEMQELIFEEFQQADGTMSRKYGGTGLGLSISRKIARVLGGGISLTSMPGAGSVFTLYLPVHCNPAAADVMMREAAPAVDAPFADHAFGGLMPKPAREMPQQVVFDPSDRALLGGKTVLIVDDDMRNVFALASAMENLWITVRYAENGRECLEMLERYPEIDLVLLDIMMPEMDGYETLQTLRRNPKYRSLPVIALTAKAMKYDRERCISAGASDYITKPIDLEQLFSLMQVWLYE